MKNQLTSYDLELAISLGMFGQINKPTEDETIGLSFRPAIISDEYRKEWNIHNDDFLQVYYNDVKVSDTLYRKGGMFNNNFKNVKYFIILKQIETTVTDKDRLKIIGKRNGKFLSDVWIIMDSKGNEVKEFDRFDSPTIIGSNDVDSIIYSFKGGIYNIETGERYCERVYESFTSSEYLFANNKYDSDESKKGVLKINLQDGSYELFK